MTANHYIKSLYAVYKSYIITMVKSDICLFTDGRKAREDDFFMEQPLVSIIVPVYNAARTLSACVKSICDQVYRNIEVILVNDGSRDDSLAICRALASMDDRIRIIDKPNSGVSSSRNAGIESARGKYLQFVDSDDLLDKNATQLLCEQALLTDSDLVISEFYRMVGKHISVSTNMVEYDPNGIVIMNQKEFAGHLMENPMNFYYGVMWNKLYRRDIIMEHGIRCSEELKWCEDFMFNLEYYGHMERIVALSVPLYYYVNRRGSLANSYEAMEPLHIIRMRQRMFMPYKQLFQNLDMYEQNRMQILMFFVGNARDGAVSPFSPEKAEVAQQLARRRIYTAMRSRKYRQSYVGSQKRVAQNRLT